MSDINPKPVTNQPRIVLEDDASSPIQAVKIVDPADEAVGADRVLRVRKSVVRMMSTPPAAVPKSHAKAIWLSILAVLLAAGGAGWWWRDAWWPGAREEKKTAAPVAESPSVPVAEAVQPAIAGLPAPTAAPAPAVPADAERVADLPSPPDLPSDIELPDTPAAAPAPAPTPRRPAGDTPASLFNSALRDYQIFLTDKAAHADMLPGIEDRARRAAKGFEELLRVAGESQQPQLNEALSQCYRLVSDCRRQNTSAVRELQAAPVSPHSGFNRATVGPKRQPPPRIPGAPSAPAQNP